MRTHKICFKICIAPLFLLLWLVFVSCNSIGSQQLQSTDSLSETQSSAVYCPLSYEEFIQKISEEMNEDEIVAIAGEPQRIEWVNLSIDPSASAMVPHQCRIYDFINDNRSIGIVYYFEGEPSDDTARTLIHVFVSEDQTT
jgi:hypothetical protein